MTALQHLDTNPIAHLSTEDIDCLGRELDAIRNRVMESRGERDARYIRRIITAQRAIEAGSRTVLLFSKWKPAWVVGTVGLSVSKILENMEISHNVMHGQWDWMRDPKIHSTTWEWDNASPSRLWKHAHNEIHHTYTNVIGKDNDLGYGIMRVDEDQRWRPFNLGQPVWNFINMTVFEYGIAAYDLQIGRVLKGRGNMNVFKRDGIDVLRKVGRQVRRDYVIHPALSGPSWKSTMLANLVANTVRNVWTHSVIMCGHFPTGVQTFTRKSIAQGETRGEWYVRQMLGSANISGSRAMHIATGNLSYQIEHHLFPDLPSNRYQEVAPLVRDICRRYGLPYVVGNLPHQVTSAWWTVMRLALPNHYAAKFVSKRARRRAAAPGVPAGFRVERHDPAGLVPTFADTAPAGRHTADSAKRRDRSGIARVAA